ncbi:hypothetical protein DBL07_27025 [Achromobacter mucicolens]|uniref:hypothetical protein n=1 Tax=Achromobacter mucicolens TaxID=1389922 RepID=UPI0007C7403C|nr:hypothetical protein [Achromobacter mucicolens]OAE53415.1 hypothetical protein A7J67_22510 [Achromobacter xylosoxidans]PTW81621.1 hypothetical protein DBL07_27025 [Achromobacter mucicolens]
MQGSFLILFAIEPPRGICQCQQTALARHLGMTLIQDRAEVCNKVLARRFKAKPALCAQMAMKKRAFIGRAWQCSACDSRRHSRNKD